MKMQPKKSRVRRVMENKLKNRLMRGSVVRVKNARRHNIKPLLVGEGIPTRVNANVGFSPNKSDLNLELRKAETAVEYGADTIMDLSVGRSDLSAVRKKILKNVKVPLGTVPIYEAFLKDNVDMTLDSILKVIEEHGRDGVDFMTLHCGITRDIVENVGERLIPIVSRGGCFLAAWMTHNRQENPLYSGFEDILELVREYDAVLSLGDALRPGSVLDASDRFQMQELLNLGRLTKIARKAGVQVIIEGPGHVPLDQIEMNVRLEKKICGNAPFYVLGPLVTDIAVGYDHITGAIGGALAGMYGADFLCYVTPSEHVGLPGVEDVKNGVIASKIAAHAADLVKLQDYGRDRELSMARKKLDWKRMFDLSLNRKDIRKKYAHLLKSKNKECTMCGRYCALKITRECIPQ